MNAFSVCLSALAPMSAGGSNASLYLALRLGEAYVNELDDVPTFSDPVAEVVRYLSVIAGDEIGTPAVQAIAQRLNSLRDRLARQ